MRQTIAFTGQQIARLMFYAASAARMVDPAFVGKSVRLELIVDRDEKSPHAGKYELVIEGVEDGNGEAQG